MYECSRLSHLLATGFGAGLSPKAPGTVGTVVAVVLYLPLSYLPVSIYLTVVLLGFVFGCYLCGQVADDIGHKDHPGIVWDEIIGFWLAMSATPSPSALSITVVFILFRFFDIVKPFPIRLVDTRCTGGFGIMIDDILAALYTMMCVWAFQAIA